MKTRPPYPFMFVLEEARSSATITWHLCVKRIIDNNIIKAQEEVIAWHDFDSLESAEEAIELLAKVLNEVICT